MNGGADVLAPLQHDTFFAKSLMVPSYYPLSQEAIQSFFDYIWRTYTSSQW
jgi:hypothetical protein